MRDSGGAIGLACSSAIQEGQAFVASRQCLELSLPDCSPFYSLQATYRDIPVPSRSQMLHARSNVVQDGDLVIVYVSHEEMKAVKVSAAGKTHVRYGIFEHQDWIGRAYGTKVFSKSGSWVYILAPTPELWTHVLSHRTQILYLADCAQICAGLNLRSGRVVCFLELTCVVVDRFTDDTARNEMYSMQCLCI